MSVVVAAYDVPGEMLAECVESVLAATGACCEVILVDDGSALPAADAMPEAARARVRVIRQAHSGLSAARNTGMEAACGEYIQFVDGDDCLLSEPYARCLALLARLRPDVLAFGQTRSRRGGRGPATPVCTSGPEYMLTRNVRASACGYVFRRELAAGLRFTPGLLHEDEEFTPLLYLRARSLCDSGAAAYYYRQRSGSITRRTGHTHTERRLRDTLRVIKHLQACCGSLSGIPQQALARRVAQLSMDCLYNAWRLTRSFEAVGKVAVQLRRLGLYPLPRGRYTWKYRAFRLTTRLLPI